MSPEAEAYQTELRQAGQPWSRRGVAVTGAGIVGLVIAQVAPTVWIEVLFLVSLAMVAAGWVMLVVAFIRRRRWAAAHPIDVPPLPDAP